MGKLAVDRFLALVERSGLVERDRLSELVETWKRNASAAELDDADRCGQYLIDAGVLTAWQCHKLMDGRWRGFMLSNYKLLDHLGSGGMSNVYLAEHVLMQRRVAIKVLPETHVGNVEYLARFRFEGQAVAALDHPNIVRAYDLGSEGRIHYLVMEYVEGSDLAVLVERRGPLPYHEAAGYVAQAANGLGHAHRAGLVHRDIKPANLLVDHRGQVKILDLGLAKSTVQLQTSPDFARDQVLGTAAYFAPEQAVNSHAVDRRADIYGLGCTLYYLLTGRAPFDGETTLELMNAHHRQTARDVRHQRPDAPEALVQLCERMMAKSPDERPQSAGEVAQALRAWLEAERVAGRLPAAATSPAGLTDERAALRDTQPNVSETAQVPRRGDRPSSHVFAPLDDPPPAPSPAGGSDGIAPPPAPAPPVVPPPREAPRAPESSVLPRAQAVSERALNASPSAPASGVFTPRATTARRMPRAARGMHWGWSLLLAALVVSAALLLLFALQQ